MRTRPSPLILANTAHGTLILSCKDYALNNGAPPMMGVGYRLLLTGSLDQDEIRIGRTLLDWRRQTHGDGCFALDCGANIGVMTIEWAKHMEGWGDVLAIEMQERVFYMLAGNLSIHNCFNARARLAAVGNHDGEASVPVPDFTKPASLGSIGLKVAPDVGQNIERRQQVEAIRIDSLELPRLDLLKLDVEGAELDVLAGAAGTIERCRPYIMAEHAKTGELPGRLESMGYRVRLNGANLLAMRADDPNWARVRAA